MINECKRRIGMHDDLTLISEDSEACNFLVEHACDVNAALDPSQDAPLHAVAASRALPASVGELLVRKGAKVNAQNVESL